LLPTQCTVVIAFFSKQPLLPTQPLTQPLTYTTNSQATVENAGGTSGTTAKTAAAAPAAAAAEEIMMAQMLLTFSHVEQARFAAYTRSKLPTRAVQDWITALLRVKLHRPGAVSLTDLVATDQANDIVWTIAMAAKIFTQRLVADAIKWSNTMSSTTTDTTPEPAAHRPSPHPAATVGLGYHPTLAAVYLAAPARRHHHNELFLQPHNGLHWPGCHHPTAVGAATHRQARLAAELAQEEYDQLHPPEDAPSSSATPEDDDNDNDGNNKDKGAAADTTTTAGKTSPDALAMETTTTTTTSTESPPNDAADVTMETAEKTTTGGS
jgi:hypothetical protein